MTTAAPPGKPKDPYQYNLEDVKEPPRTLPMILRRIGPGIILAASIVGSGELIATTTLGAQVGYAALWVIILSCFIKPVVQAEMGRYTIASGETCLESFDHVPGPRWRVSWVVWAWVAMVLMTLLQVGAMFGGVSQVMHAVVPEIPVNLWIVIFLGITLALLLGGGYDRIEHLATLKVALFTMLTFLCALLLLRRPEFFSWPKLLSGLTFRMPGNGLATAVAVFGITGVGAAELVMYPYWCVEKGYARFTGKRDGSPGWESRARGWVKVMHVDILCSMIIYTIATLAFYLLGAGVLNGMGLIPAAKDMIQVLSKIYTEILGPWSLYLFYLGAIATLYGTIFAATASNSRVFADLCRMLGLFERGDYAARVRYRRRFVVVLTVIPVGLILFIQSPVLMVVIGGICQSVMLPIIGAATLHMRYRRMPEAILPARLTTVLLWVSAIVMAAAVAYGLLTGQA
ncbi:MAG: Nramp family divalent metal transporter [Acidobacteria bacterium]|nr:Nramp family divalent metal transporter [Acidobacteriota bacterium]